jgi:flagellin
MQDEFNQLTSEINRIGNTTEFNTQKLLNGNANGGSASATALQTNGTSGDISVSGSATSNQLITITLTGTTYTIDQHNGVAAATQTTMPTSVDGLTISTAGMSTVKSGDSWSIMATAAGTGKSVTLQIGANQDQSMSLDIGDMRAAALGLTGTTGSTGFTKTNGVTDGTSNTASEAGLDVSNSTNATNAITVIQGAIDRVSSERAKLGSYENRLDHTINNLNTSSQNITDAQSRIADVDMAKEMMTQSKYSVLAQAAQTMLAKANQQPQQVLQLLQQG